MRTGHLERHFLPGVNTLAVRWPAERVRSAVARRVELCEEALVLPPALAARAEVLALVDESFS
jgi:hypothetical protein